MASEKPEHEDELVSDHAECQMAKEKSPLTKKESTVLILSFSISQKNAGGCNASLAHGCTWMTQVSKWTTEKMEDFPERERWWIERLGFGASVQGGLLVSCHIHGFFLKL